MRQTAGEEGVLAYKGRFLTKGWVGNLIQYKNCLIKSCFILDETYARYSPKHARKIAIAKQKKTKELKQQFLSNLASQNRPMDDLEMRIRDLEN